jgi:hypothetical protein
MTETRQNVTHLVLAAATCLRGGFSGSVNPTGKIPSAITMPRSLPRTLLTP